MVVSDGLETCGGAPCEVVEEAKKAGIKFVMHVIGFDLDKEKNVLRNKKVGILGFNVNVFLYWS